MQRRTVKFYLIVTAVAALLSVVLGFYLSFGDGNQDTYCEFEIPTDRSALATVFSSCQLRFGLVLSVFGRIYLVFLAIFWVPVGLYVWGKKWIETQLLRHGPLTSLGPVEPVGASSFERREHVVSGIEQKIERWAWPFFTGYFTVSALCIFALISFPAWIGLVHNPQGSYCQFSYPSTIGNFYAQGDPCNIEWVGWLTYYFGSAIVAIAILQTPMVLLGAFCFLLQCFRHFMRSGR